VKSFNKTSKSLTLRISVDNANANANSSVEELQQAIREITGVNKINTQLRWWNQVRLLGNVSIH
jgi:hypothetical protein